MNYIILIPVFNDWECLALLHDKIDAFFNHKLPNDSFRIFAVNDFSTLPAPEEKLQHISVIHLNRNLGHQRAIAIGLSYIAENETCDKVIVMDSDGEDVPEDIIKLIQQQAAEPNKVVFAQRTKRKEGLVFKLFYAVYKFLFKKLTGHPINFGNFCLLNFETVKKVVFVPEIWNHFASAVIRSKVTYTTVPIEKGLRLAGNSKMNFNSLILHGLSAISVYIETVSIRLILYSLIFLGVAITGIVAVTGIRLFTEWAIPGWATFTVLALAIMSFQALIVFLFLVFMVLSYRSNKQIIPAHEYKHFIQTVSKK